MYLEYTASVLEDAVQAGCDLNTPPPPLPRHPLSHLHAPLRAHHPMMGQRNQWPPYQSQSVEKPSDCSACLQIDIHGLPHPGPQQDCVPVSSIKRAKRATLGLPTCLQGALLRVCGLRSICYTCDGFPHVEWGAPKYFFLICYFA